MISLFLSWKYHSNIFVFITAFVFKSSNSNSFAYLKMHFSILFLIWAYFFFLQIYLLFYYKKFVVINFEYFFSARQIFKKSYLLFCIPLNFKMHILNIFTYLCIYKYVNVFIKFPKNISDFLPKWSQHQFSIFQYFFSNDQNSKFLPI